MTRNDQVKLLLEHWKDSARGISVSLSSSKAAAAGKEERSDRTAVAVRTGK